jgi:hypothetical protein
VVSGSHGVGNGEGTFRVAGNGGPARTGTITIANELFTITQGARP